MMNANRLWMQSRVVALVGLFWALPTTAGPIMRDGAPDCIDLGDLAVGGNGYGSAAVGTGLRIEDGQLVSPGIWAGVSAGGPLFVPTKGQDGSADLPFVDGVFLANGVTPVIGSGETYGFPGTNGTQYDAIRNAAADYDICVSPPRLVPIRLSDQPGVDRRGLGIHANGGITFDLCALRQAGYSLLSVEGVAGLNYDVIGTDGWFEVWVLVDGVQRYHSQFSGRYGTPYQSFSIPLATSDHYLSLAVTDHDMDGSWDHGVIADARITIPEPGHALAAGNRYRGIGWPATPVVNSPPSQPSRAGSISRRFATG